MLLWIWCKKSVFIFVSSHTTKCQRKQWSFTEKSLIFHHQQKRHWHQRLRQSSDQWFRAPPRNQLQQLAPFLICSSFGTKNCHPTFKLLVTEHKTKNIIHHLHHFISNLICASRSRCLAKLALRTNSINGTSNKKHPRWHEMHSSLHQEYWHNVIFWVARNTACKNHGETDKFFPPFRPILSTGLSSPRSYNWNKSAMPQENSSENCN